MKKNELVIAVIVVAVITVLLLTHATPVVSMLSPKPLPQDALAQYDSKTRMHIDKAVAASVYNIAYQNTALDVDLYEPVELTTEGHIILSTEEQGNSLTVYALTSGMNYEFQDGVFVPKNGYKVMPAVMVFSKDANKEFTLVSYEEPAEGESNVESTKELFPQPLWYFVFNPECAVEKLAEQEMKQVKEYLKSIGREKAPVGSVKGRIYFNIFDSFDELADYPNWLGNREQLENGTRYIYESSRTKKGDSIIFSFTKKKEDSTIVEQFRYKVLNGNIKLIYKE